MARVATYKCLGATAECFDGELFAVRLRGVVCLGAMGGLAAQMSAEAVRLPANLAYYDRSLLLFDWREVLSSREFSPSGGRAGAMIVRAEQLKAATYYCAALAQRGVLRMAFTVGEEQLARQWALAAEVPASAARYSRESIRV
jgi:hypothetical protein